jgi:hypothetical protein
MTELPKLLSRFEQLPMQPTAILGGINANTGGKWYGEQILKSSLTLCFSDDLDREVSNRFKAIEPFNATGIFITAKHVTPINVIVRRTVYARGETVSRLPQAYAITPNTQVESTITYEHRISKAEINRLKEQAEATTKIDRLALDMPKNLKNPKNNIQYNPQANLDLIEQTRHGLANMAFWLAYNHFRLSDQ